MPGEDIEFIASTGAEIKDIWVSGDKDIWMATYGKGLIYYDDSLRIVKTISGLLDDYTYCLEADIRGRIWIGTDRGINILKTDGSLIGSISHDEGLPDVLVTALYQDDDGRMWIGMESGGISYVDLGSGIEKVIIPDPSWEFGMVTAILQSNNGIIVATRSSGIFHLKEIITSGGLQPHFWSVSPDIEIIGLVEDHHRNIIILTPGDMMLTPGETIQLWTSMNGFTFHDIHALHIDDNGNALV